QCQALERTQPGLPLGVGEIRTKTHDYKRHGTITEPPRECWRLQNLRRWSNEQRGEDAEVFVGSPKPGNPDGFRARA
ncbi:MAG: hypothetical protein FJW31_31355, partial [Acidobacteria bacterium]|nr:hypothetical protein [Acidobacteriota bacterium]